MHFLCWSLPVVRNQRRLLTSSNVKPSLSLFFSFSSSLVPPSNRPPALINNSSDLSRLTCLPIGQPGRVVNLPLDCCSIFSLPRRGYVSLSKVRTFGSFHGRTRPIDARRLLSSFFLHSRKGNLIRRNLIWFRILSELLELGTIIAIFRNYFIPRCDRCYIEVLIELK